MDSHGVTRPIVEAVHGEIRLRDVAQSDAHSVSFSVDDVDVIIAWIRSAAAQIRRAKVSSVPKSIDQRAIEGVVDEGPHVDDVLLPRQHAADRDAHRDAAADTPLAQIDAS